MKKPALFLAALLAVALFNQCNHEPGKASLQYPETKKVEQSDTYFGTTVSDPYRWLEDDNAEDTKAWVEAQNKVTNDYLSQIPYRDALNKRLMELVDFERVTAPEKVGEYYIYTRNDGTQNQSVYYIRKGLEGKAEVLLDPNTLSEDGTVSVSGLSASGDSKYLAYQVSASGSDWREIRVMDLESRSLLEDKLDWVKFSNISWRGNGFFYNRYEAPAQGDELKSANTNMKVYYHTLGTSQDEDVLAYEDPENPGHFFGVDVTEDERYLVLFIAEGTSGNQLWIKDLEADGDYIKVMDAFSNDNSIVGNEGSTFFMQTNVEAPNKRLVSFGLSTPDQWTDLIPEANEVLSVSYAGGKFFASYLKDARTVVYQHDKEGKREFEVVLPGVGTARGFDGGNKAETLFYTYTSFTEPGTVYQYDIATGTSSVFFEPELPFDASRFEAKQIFYNSKDGTRVPMFVIHEKGLELDGNNPTILYGYGGFDISLTPRYSSSLIAWLENGGVYASANLRGGGEYGANWHEAGTKMRKQNVFNDCIAAAEFLIAEGYTNKEKLAVNGRSNGGLLVGAVMTQRPDLFAVALPGVGVLDMLRYQNFTIGAAWASDYGTSADSKEMFEYLHAYSPLHNIKAGTNYPATMVITADHDDRVVPAHSFKFGATLQEKHVGAEPVIIRIETKAGHGAGVPIAKRLQEITDMYAFSWYNMGYQPPKLTGE